AHRLRLQARRSNEPGTAIEHITCLDHVDRFRDALVAGERNPRTLADLATGNLVKKKAALAEALTGQFEDHHGRLLSVFWALSTTPPRRSRNSTG
ncbi:hypothetical protein ACIOWI_36250, partial [Streptomyces sp. NPDC087659]